MGKKRNNGQHLILQNLPARFNDIQCSDTRVWNRFIFERGHAFLGIQATCQMTVFQQRGGAGGG